MPFLDEIKDRLVAQSVGVYGSNIFLGSRAVIPNADGPYLTVIETGGTSPLRIHNVPGAHVQRPTAQIAVRGTTYPPTLAMARAAYVALDGVWNTTLSGTFYQKITARQEPMDLGQLDAKGRVVIVFNIEVEKVPS